MPSSEQLSPVPRLGARACVAILLLSLGARLGATAVAGFSALRFGDARAYLFAAETLARTGHYPIQTDYLSFRAPGYPVFIILATLGNPSRIAFAKAANALLGAFSALVLAALAARIFRRRALAIATGGLAAVHPAFLLVSTDIQSEPLFLLLLLCAGFLLLVATDRPSSSLAVGAGVFLALAALTRPSALALAPLLLAPLGDRRYPLRARSHICGAALCGFLLTLAPWTARNALVFRELLPVNDFAGVSFYIGNSDVMLRFYDVRSLNEYHAWIGELDGIVKRRSAELEALGPISRGERSRQFVRMALAERLADPHGTARLYAHKIWDWLRPYPNPLFWPRWVVIGIGLYYLALFFFAAAGLAAAPRHGVRLVALGLLAISMVSHLLLIVVWRYRIPYWDPVLLLYGVFGGDRLPSRWKPRT